MEELDAKMVRPVGAMAYRIEASLVMDKHEKIFSTGGNNVVFSRSRH